MNHSLPDSIVTHPDSPVGRVVATERKPNTAFEFHFWSALDASVGIGTIEKVVGRTPVEGQLPVIYGVVMEGFAYTDLQTPLHDVLGHDDEILKLAVVDFHDAVAVAAGLAAFSATHQIVVSSHRWVDIMSRSIDKGVAVRALQDRLGIAASQTAVFGDYLNDLQMLDAAEHSFAMANAHPTVRERARHVAGSNVEHGVVEAIERLLTR